jgi:hypothetical protein
MSLEGLRAWIGEVERKLGKRTRVFLALTVLAIGIAGASLYLAIEAQNDSVSEADVQALQQKLETRIDEVAAGGAATAPTVPPVETEPEPAPPEETRPKSEGDNQDQSPQGGNGTNSGTSNSSPGATGSAPQSSSGGRQDKSARILELLEQTKKQNTEAEAQQNAK